MKGRPKGRPLDDVIERLLAGMPAAGVAARLRAGPGDYLVVSAPALLEAVLKELLGVPDAPAAVTFIPGAATELALSPDGVVLRHLNQGAALEPGE